jgi:hypothetical protein
MIRREFNRWLCGATVLIGSPALAAMQDQTKEIELRIEGMV